jgi:endoribonuclease Dicer
MFCPEVDIAENRALLTLHSAVSHLMHFCAVIPNSTHAINQPHYAVDPPEFPEGWHAFAGGRMQPRLPYTGPYGSRVTLPRSLPLPERHFSVDCVYKNIISAHRHSAFKAYKALYDARLLNENLLPITSVLEPELEEEVKAMLADVEKREGLAKVSMSINPWLPTDFGSEEVADSWHQSRLHIGDLPPLFLFTRSAFIKLDAVNGPLLYRAGIPPIGTSIEYVGKATLRDTDLRKARNYTRLIFWSLNNTRMEWNNLDFSYLILPVGNGDQEWDARRSWLSNISNADSTANPYPLMVRANELGVQFGYPSDLTLIQRQIGAGSPFKFVRWQYESVSEEEEEAIRERYKHVMDLEITYPLLVVEKFPPRSNFLIPTPPPKENGMDTPANKPPATIHFIPRLSSVVLLSPEESEYAFFLPSVLRFLSMSITANSLRNTVFTESPISVIPLSPLITAITAPSSGERLNYQRMETLGDTVLKFMTGIQLMAEYPLWHEGYLTRKKDHAVSNVRLAKEDIKRGLYRWIIRGFSFFFSAFV